MIARSVVLRELNKYQKDDSLSFSIDTKDNDLTHLRVTLTPPDNTPYEDGIFFLSVTIPSHYPSTPPNIEFETKIYHPNITKDGEICLKGFKDDWKPTFTLKNAIDFIYRLLEDPDWESPLETSIAAQHKKDPNAFKKTAGEWTKKYAI
ncbi:hypothetical protein M9Y10_032439 [Tritrichomonas musculus]|uniref:UBC core domain-containing protein n=1 Tax=Tritrichomonas musculus TaxID=1915356 RepID=A0ABR2GYF4_9EUKA